MAIEHCVRTNRFIDLDWDTDFVYFWMYPEVFPKECSQDYLKFRGCHLQSLSEEEYEQVKDDF